MNPTANSLAERGTSPAASPPLAVRHGEPLQARPEQGKPLTFLLERAARQSASRGCIQLQADGTEVRQTYAELLRDAERIAGGLRRAGVMPGAKILFQLESGQEFFPAFWACTLGGFVPVPTSLPPDYVNPHSALTKLRNAWTLLEQPILLTQSARVPALVEFGARQKLAGWTVLAVEILREGPPDPQRHLSEPAQTAVLLLTSGSTGLPKAVALTHANLVSHTIGNVQLNQLTTEDVSLNWMPLDHVGALVMFHLRDVFLGCDQIHVLPEIILQNPRNWLAWMHRHRVASTWAPNFAFALINDLADTFEDASWDLSRLRLIINGGEAVVSRTGRRFLALLGKYGLPGTAIHPAWGMSETSSGTTYSYAFQPGTVSDNDTFVSVGGPMPGISLRIVDPEGAIVPEGTTGALEVKGVVITPGYYLNPQANADAFTSDGWFKTGDLGILQAGQLTIVGREKDVIIINGVNFHGHEIEAVVEQLKGIEVSFTAACAVRPAGVDTDELAVFFALSDPKSAAVPALTRQIRARVLKELGVNIDHLIVLPKEKIPKTAIGKIQRPALKKDFEAGVFSDQLRAGSLPSWFFRREWRLVSLANLPNPDKKRTWVIFKDQAGLGERLINEFAARAEPVLGVESGASFEVLGPSSVVINPALPGDYDRLLEFVSGKDTFPCTFVHLWTFAAIPVATGAVAELDAPFRAGADSALLLAAAFTRSAHAETPARLLVVSSGAQAVTADEPVVAAHGALLGLLKTIPQEIAGLDTSHLDLPFAVTTEAVTAITGEASSPALHAEVAFRSGQRFISGLTALDRTEKPAATPPLKAGGVYLVTGGLGGVGRELIEVLLKKLQARVVLTGREPGEKLSPEKRDALGEMQRLGQVVYEPADVADLAAMRAVWQRATARWGTAPDGVFHLAGTYQERVLAEETVAGLNLSLHAKARGAWVIGELIRNHPETQVVLFSSLLGYFGGFMTGAYAAANHFLEQFTRQQRQQGRHNIHCLAWSSWADLGMSRGLRDNVALRAKGFQEINPIQGWDSLCVALESSEPVVLIGLDSTNKQLAPHLSADAQARFCETISRAPLVEARDDVERKLISIWKNLLKVDAVGVQDSFFDLGGRSLLAARLFAQIDKEFGKSLPLATLFTFSTIEQLATLIKGSSSPKPGGNRVITLQAAGTKPPLFCIPGRETNNLMYRDLVRALGKDQPLYSLKADSLTSAGIALGIEQCALELVEQIRTTRPKGPYQISGHGFGAVLAWEVARLLAVEASLVVLLQPAGRAFFAAVAESSPPSYRFIKPEKPGLLKSLFGQAAVSRASQNARDLYGDATLPALATKVVVFDGPADELPWRDLARADFRLLDIARVNAELPALLAP